LIQVLVDNPITFEFLQTPQVVFPAPSSTVPYPEAINITVGDAYYQSVEHLPPSKNLAVFSDRLIEPDSWIDTRVIWGLNLGQNNMTSTFLSTKSIIKAFASQSVTSKGITLEALEIGNEPDLFKNNGARPSTYDITQYVKE
jgi:hypothetical protein